MSVFNLNFLDGQKLYTYRILDTFIKRCQVVFLLSLQSRLSAGKCSKLGSFLMTQIQITNTVRVFVLHQEQEEQRSTEAYTIFNHMLRVRQDLNSAVPSFREGMRCISTLFPQYNQEVSYNNTPLCTRRHMKLYHGCTRAIACTCTSCLFVRVRTNLLAVRFCPHPWRLCGFRAHDYIESSCWPCYYITHGNHRPTGSMRGHTPKLARATGTLTRSLQIWEFSKWISQLPCLGIFKYILQNTSAVTELWASIRNSN